MLKGKGLGFSEIPGSPNMHQTLGTQEIESEELFVLIAAWPTLPGAIKADIYGQSDHPLSSNHFTDAATPSSPSSHPY